MSSVFKTVDGALAFRGGFDSHALSPSKVEALKTGLAVAVERAFRSALSAKPAYGASVTAAASVMNCRICDACSVVCPTMPVMIQACGWPR